MENKNSGTNNFSGSEESSFRKALKKELVTRALQFGDFVLASGQKSTYYINCKPVTLSAHGSYLSGMNLLHALPPECQAVGGLVIGADPLVSSITVLSSLKNRPVDGFLIRKEPKGHGTQSQIENSPLPGTKVVIVEDVITTGGSALKASRVSRDLGLEVILALCLVDRCQGGEEAFRELGIPMKSIFKIEELLNSRDEFQL